MTRVSEDRAAVPPMRGAATGALWLMNESQSDRVLASMRLFTDPAQLGDFLTGLFYVAREKVQRDSDLLASIDGVIMEWSDEEFLHAVPALRLAFSFFTPREKHHMLVALFNALKREGVSEKEAQIDLKVDATAAASAIAFEARLFEALKRYGIRGGGDER